MLSPLRPGKTAAHPLFLQDCVAVNPQDVVDTADSQTFSTADPGRAGRARALRG